MPHILQVVALCIATYIVSIPVAYVCVPLLRLVGLVPLKENEPSWGTAAIWPVIILIGLFILPIEVVSRLHDRVEEYVKSKKEEEVSLNPAEPNPLSFSESHQHMSKPRHLVINEGERICPYCRKVILEYEEKLEDKESKLQDETGSE